MLCDQTDGIAEGRVRTCAIMFERLPCSEKEKSKPNSMRFSYLMGLQMPMSNFSPRIYLDIMLFFFL